MASDKTDSIDLLDEAELAGDNAEVYLFQWLASTKKKLGIISATALKPQQATLEKTLLTILSTPPPPSSTAANPNPPQAASGSRYVAPGRVFRNLVAQCFISIYRVGETRTLFDTLQACLKLVPFSSSSDKDRDLIKIAAFWCIGELMGVYGAQYMSFMSEIATVTIKTYRSSSNPLLRYHALIALEKSLRTAKRAVSESTMKDINKQMKTALVDKAWAVQRGATQVLIALHSGSDGILLTTSEIESVLSQSIKSLDGGDRPTRQAHARLVGHLLSLSQLEGRKEAVSTAAATEQRTNKGKAGKGGEDDGDSLTTPGEVTIVTSSAAEQKAKPLLTPQEMLAYLSKELNKSTASRKTRIAMFEVYEALFIALGAGWVETNLGAVISHLVGDVITHPRLGLLLGAIGVSASNSASGAVMAGSVVGNPARYEALLLRRLVSILLRDLVAVRMLSEQGQIGAIGEWATNYLKRWPAMMPGQVEPKEAAIVLALREVGGLVVLLGNTPGVVQNALADPLVTLLSHPSHAVRVNASWALRCFCASTPLRLGKVLLTIIDKLSSQLSALLTPTPTPGTPQRALGHAYALAALVSLIPHRPWYVSYDVPSKIMDTAIQLLKKAGEHAVPVASVEIEVAWRLMSGCMGLGKGFIRGYLAQLLVLWRNALPKVTSKDSAAAGRSGQEWGFLLHVRESALGAVWCFLRSHAMVSTDRGNGGLITLDVARRIIACLSNALSFANSFLSVASSVEDPMFSLSGTDLSSAVSNRRSGLSLRDREALLRRRVFECFSLLSAAATMPAASAIPSSASYPSAPAVSTMSAISDSTQDALLRGAIGLFASPEGYGGSAVQAAITSSTGTFSSVWATAGVGDGYAYGVGWKVVDDVLVAGGADAASGSGNEDGLEDQIDDLMRRPVLGACEHDPLSVCLPSPGAVIPSLSLGGLSGSSIAPSANNASSSSTSLTSPTSPYYLYEPPPPATAVVDASIELFARLLPLQDLPTTLKILQHLIEEVRSNKAEKNAGRRGAVWVNACVAIVLALRVAMSTRSAAGLKDVWGNEKVATGLGAFLMEALTDGDPVLRAAASESIGRLSSLSGTSYLASQIKDLVDMVVNNRTPSSRAGCAWAFGAIHSYVGGLAAGPLLKTTVNILMSLASDPHPLVHYHSLRALGKVVDAASLGYGPYVTQTLGMLLNVYLLDSHEKESGGGGGSKNVDVSEGWGESAVDQVACRVIDALIGVLGPDIQENTRTRNVILGLVNEFWLEGESGGGYVGQVGGTNLGSATSTVGVGVEAIRCIQHFLIFAPEHADIPVLVNRFRSHLSSSSSALRPLKVASINALYQLVQKDAVAMSTMGGDKLVEDLFALLDDGDDVSVSRGVRNVIQSWLGQTGVLNPRAWIGLCQRIMRKTTAGQRVVDGTNAGRDDEGESLSGGNSDAGNSTNARGHQTSRWRTQLFALQCLHSICGLVVSSGRKEHISSIVARSRGLPLEGMLFSSVGDLIKMAFTASTAYVTEIRLAGLVVLRDVIETFATSPDPAYDDALLLEQHQAPITAALTPAFSSDSNPEILASAVDACAVFVGCGVVKDVGRMGRILRLLTTALEQSKDSGMLSLGEAGELSPNASAMLRISTLSAWAQLRVASARQSYLDDVLKPYQATLASLWIAALRDYASIRVDSEGLNGDSVGSGSVIDSSYGTLGREVLLPYYTKSWPVILDAVATAMDRSDPHILAAMDGQDSTIVSGPPIKGSPTRTEPTAFFYILFGLVYESLSTSAVDLSSSPQPSQTDKQSMLRSSLRALKSLVRPEYAGKAIFNEPTIFDEFLSLCYRMVMTEPADVQVLLVEVLKEWAVASFAINPSSRDRLQMTESPAHCLRMCSNVIRQAAGYKGSIGMSGHLSDRTEVIQGAISAFTLVSSLLQSAAERENVRAVGILLYTDLLKVEVGDADFISPTLPLLKGLLEVPLISPREEDHEAYSRLIHALLSSCLLNVDSMRGRSGAISTRKTQNNLLAAVLVLTIAPAWVKVGRTALEHCCFLLTQKLSDLDETTLTAAHCTKTLILASSTSGSMLRQCSRLLIPGAIEFVAKLIPFIRDGSITEQHAAAINEIWKAFAGLYTSSPQDHRSRLLGVFLPTISLTLSPNAPAQSQAASIHGQAVAQLLSFATSSPAAFKDVTAKLEPGSRELLEQSIRKAVGGHPSAAGHSNVKPQISLRSF